jgi:hypothetical protein
MLESTTLRVGSQVIAYGALARSEDRRHDHLRARVSYSAAGRCRIAEQKNILSEMAMRRGRSPAPTAAEVSNFSVSREAAEAADSELAVPDMSAVGRHRDAVERLPPARPEPWNLVDAGLAAFRIEPATALLTMPYQMRPRVGHEVMVGRR